MNWLTNFIRPRIRSLVEPKEVPDNLWQKCSACEGMLFNRDLEKNLNVCYHCGYHLRITVKQRLPLMFDGGHYERLDLPDVAFDPLKFKDRRKYAERLKESQAKTGLKDAMTLAKGTIGGQRAVVAAFNFSFMGGSMGAGVGESIIRGAEEAVRTNSAFIVIPSSGGARMQEGMLSLLQMPRSIIAVEMVKEARLPYIVLLTDPTIFSKDFGDGSKQWASKPASAASTHCLAQYMPTSMTILGDDDDCDIKVLPSCNKKDQAWSAVIECN